MISIRWMIEALTIDSFLLFNPTHRVTVLYFLILVGDISGHFLQKPHSSSPEITFWISSLHFLQLLAGSRLAEVLCLFPVDEDAVVWVMWDCPFGMAFCCAWAAAVDTVG